MKKTEIVKNYIINKIKSKELNIGSKLPTEPIICNECNVSTITVRNALNELANENIIKKIQGSGSYIKDISKFIKKKYILICLENQYLKYSITEIYPKISLLLKDKIEEMGYVPFIYYVNENEAILSNLNINPNDIICLVAISSKDIFQDFIKYEIPIINVLFGENENYLTVTMDLLDLYNKIFEYINVNNYKNPLIIGLKPDGIGFRQHWIDLIGINSIINKNYTFIADKEYTDFNNKIKTIENYIKSTKEKHDLIVLVDNSLYKACEYLFNKYDYFFKNTQILTHINSISPIAKRYNTDFIEFDISKLINETINLIDCIINKKYIPFYSIKIKCSIKYENKLY